MAVDLAARATEHPVAVVAGPVAVVVDSDALATCHAAYQKVVVVEAAVVVVVPSSQGVACEHQADQSSWDLVAVLAGPFVGRDQPDQAPVPLVSAAADFLVCPAHRT